MQSKALHFDLASENKGGTSAKVSSFGGRATPS